MFVSCVTTSNTRTCLILSTIQGGNIPLIRFRFHNLLPFIHEIANIHIMHINILRRWHPSCSTTSQPRVLHNLHSRAITNLSSATMNENKLRSVNSLNLLKNVFEFLFLSKYFLTGFYRSN